MYIYSRVSAQSAARGSGGQGTRLHRNRHIGGAMGHGTHSGMRFDRAGANVSDPMQGIEGMRGIEALDGDTSQLQLLRRTATSYGPSSGVMHGQSTGIVRTSL